LGLGLALATVRFAGATLRALPRLADFPLGSFARFCTFDAFLRLATIDTPVLVCAFPRRIGARSKDSWPSPSIPSYGLLTGRFAGLFYFDRERGAPRRAPVRSP
jgi:hypothetical protein